jgi:hypothetical protein
MAVKAGELFHPPSLEVEVELVTDTERRDSGVVDDTR